MAGATTSKSVEVNVGAVKNDYISADNSNGDAHSDQTETRRSFYERLYNFFGFTKGYNFPLFIIFAGALLGFTLARVEYWNYDVTFKDGAIPGEWYWFHEGHYRLGLLIHLSAIMPASLFVIWQFIPVIRHKFLLFHRINGHIVIIMLLISNAAALMIARRAGGGELSAQAGTGVLVLMTTISVSLAYYNIRVKQIDQHRAWMLRTFFYAASIITLRIIMIIAVKIITLIGSYDGVWTCAQINFMYGPTGGIQLYPDCIDAPTSQKLSPIHADYNGQGPPEIGVAFNLSFGMAMWLALFLHAVGVEIYLQLTPREAERLRQVSYERQLESGFKNPGSAGTVVEKFGDAEPWEPRR